MQHGVDELAKWKQGQAAWDMLQFALRLGDDPRQCVTTTPRNVGVLKTILGHSSTVKNHAPTAANQANLAGSFLAEVHARYAGTRLDQQELNGLLIEGVDGALWTDKMLRAAQIDSLPDLDRVIVAIDPPVTGHSKSDDCGIIVAGAVTSGPVQDWRAYVLADVTISGSSPTKWATVAVAALTDGVQSGLSPRSTKGVIWLKQLCGRLPRWFLIVLCALGAVKSPEPNLLPPFTSRARCITQKDWANWKSKCAR